MNPTGNIAKKIPDAEFIKIKRAARVYKTIFIKVTNILSIFLIISSLYFFRVGLTNLSNEIRISYAALFEEVGRIGDLIGILSNKKIDKLSIEGLSYLDKKDIVVKMHEVDKFGDLQMLPSVYQMYKNIKSIPIVEKVTIRRSISQGLMSVKVEEKKLVGIVRDKITNQLKLLDGNGNLIDHKIDRRFSNLPVIEDVSNPIDFIPVYSYILNRSIYDKIELASMVSGRRWNLKFRNGLLVKLPNKNWQDAIDVLLHMDEKMSLFGQENTISYIDLRIPGKIFLK